MGRRKGFLIDQGGPPGPSYALITLLRERRRGSEQAGWGVERREVQGGGTSLRLEEPQAS